jgi:hypothetical protein
MNHPLPQIDSPVLPHVWSDLPSDLQRHAVRLLAQLAYAHVRPPTPPSTQEITYDPSTPQSQDPPRPS